MRSLLLASAPLCLVLSAPAWANTPPLPPQALAPVPEGKLTDAAAPRAYRLDLTIDPAQERFSGKAEIDVMLRRPSTFIDLHGRGLTMTKAVARVGGRAIPASWNEIDESGVVRLVFAEALPAGDLVLAFEYDAPFQSGPAGLFRVKVADQWYSWSQFQSIDGRAAFPAFDEPGFKTPFTVTLRTRPGHVAVSNAPEVSKSQEDGWDVHRFAPTLPLPTYLVAMIVGPFAVAEGAVAPTPQRAQPLPLRVVTTQPNKDKMSFALEGSKDIVRLLEDYFADGFPYPKLDQITSPIMPGAMENAGADLYGDAILIMDEKATTAQKRTFGMVVAHELGHQWFGDLVTPAWWDDIWLNESFANWMGYRIGHEWRPDLNIGAGALAEGFDSMRTDELVAGRPIRQPIERNAQIDEAFDGITYGKGGHVVAMTAGFMGDSKFRDGVRRYMRAHRYGSATSADFFGAMAEASGDARILPAMQGFTGQQGVPLLTFERNKGGYRISQSRYASIGMTVPATRWQVPMCLRKGEQRHCELVGDSGASVSIHGKGALIPNAGGTGYYRFELPRRDWDALIKQADRLPGGEALALADSLYASFRAGRASAGQLARLARNLARNPDTQASDAAVDNLAELQGAGLFDDRARSSFRKLIEEIYRPQLAKLGLDLRAGAHAGDTPERSQRRRQVVERLSNLARDAKLRQTLDEAGKAWLAGDTQALDVSFYRQAFAVRIAAGGKDAAAQLLEKALASEDPVMRPAALIAIASSGDDAIGRWVLDGLKDKRLRQSEWLNMTRAVIGAPGTRDMGFDWLKTNLDRLTSGTGGIFFTSRVPNMLAGYCSVEQAQQVAEFLRPRYAGKTGALEVERSVERVANCGKLKDARAQDVSRDLAKLR